MSLIGCFMHAEVSQLEWCLLWLSPVGQLMFIGLGALSFSDNVPLLLQSLSFARAASVMRACAFKVLPGTDPAALKLPFIGPARAQQICDLATSGTTPELEEHRRVQHSDLHCCLLKPFLPLHTLQSTDSAKSAM